jgi:hypothetical protein
MQALVQRPSKPCNQPEPIDFAARAERIAVLQAAHDERRRDKQLSDLMDFYATNPLIKFQEYAIRLLEHAQSDPFWCPY